MTMMKTLGSLRQSVVSASARQTVLAMGSRFREGRLTMTLPGGKTRTFGKPGTQPDAAIEVLDEEFFQRLLFHGEIGFGEAYVDGLFRTDDLVALLEFGLRNRSVVNLNLPALSWTTRLKDLRLHRGRKNTRENARANIHAHYDLGNDFYSLFLDESMTYSSAIYDSPDQPLAEAQQNKYRHIAEMAGIRQGERVLEIGSGWGGFALYAARTLGCHVTTITISREQLEEARRRVAAAGLSSLVSVEFVDYRDVTGEFDRVVSIEMLEAVGHEYFEAYFQKIDRVLRPGGAAAIQVITVPDRAYEAQKNGVNWIQKYIFPGGVLPSLSAMEHAMRRTGLIVSRTEDIAAHYAITLRTWRKRFFERIDEVRALGFDDRFVRLWEYYLAASEAGFLTRTIGDLQLRLDKPAGRASAFTG